MTWHNEVIDLLENTELDFSKSEHKVHRRLADFGVHKYGRPLSPKEDIEEIDEATP